MSIRLIIFRLHNLCALFLLFHKMFLLFSLLFFYLLSQLPRIALWKLKKSPKEKVKRAHARNICLQNSLKSKKLKTTASPKNQKAILLGRLKKNKNKNKKRNKKKNKNKKRNRNRNRKKNRKTKAKKNKNKNKKYQRKNQMNIITQSNRIQKPKKEHFQQ